MLIRHFIAFFCAIVFLFVPLPSRVLGGEMIDSDRVIAVGTVGEDGAPKYDISSSFTCSNFLLYVRNRIDRPYPLPIYPSHVAGIMVISVFDREITSLNGVEYFTMLTELNVWGNQLTNLDVSNNHTLSWLRASNNQLTTIDVSNNPMLRYLYVSGNKLTILDVTNNPVLRLLETQNNLIASPDDVIGWQDIFPTYDWEEQIAGVWSAFIFSPQKRQDITLYFTCPNFLSYVRTRTNRPYPLSIYPAHVSGITQLSASDRNITSLSGIQYFSNIENIVVQGNNISELDLSGLNYLRHLNASNNNLATLDVTSATALEALSISRNGMSTLAGLDTLENLEVFWAESNAFAALSFHPEAPLERIDVRGNALPLSRENITGATVDSLLNYNPAGIFRPRTWARLRILSGLAL